jgi:hypothetical protein
MFTQPLMYKKIRSHKNSHQRYVERLIEEGSLSKAQVTDGLLQLLLLLLLLLMQRGWQCLCCCCVKPVIQAWRAKLQRLLQPACRCSLMQKAPVRANIATLLLVAAGARCA